MTSDSSMSADSDMKAKIEEYSDLFDEACRQRHEMGVEKYGAGKFLTVNTLEEAAYEVLDLANYARYSFIKLMLLNEYLESLETIPDQEGFQPVGKDWQK